MNDKIISGFFDAYFASNLLSIVYSDDIPQEMLASPVNEDGWVAWRPIKGTFTEEKYHLVERNFRIKLPKSFIEFHKRYFFLDGDCYLLNLPYSNPNRPLEKLIDVLDNDHARYLADIDIYPFAMEGNDSGFLVFDGRGVESNNEFPIRVFDYMSSEELDGLSAIIFSSFTKLLECLTHFMRESKTRNNFEIVLEFMDIDPLGAGKYGSEYWKGWSKMLKAIQEDNEKNPWPF
ncbi:MAG: hypothetical protein ACQUHE_10820 [Bacteroidia bacterium]